MAVALNFRRLGDTNRPHVIIIHGLFGSASNWRSIARQLENDYCLWLVDLRNHGDSPHSSDMTYTAMAQDLATFIDQHCEGRATLIGHSMGGKAAMVSALMFPDKVSALMVMDSAPVSHPSGFDAYARAMMDIEVTDLESRAQADTALSTVVSEPGVRAFLLQNLRRNETGWHWRINLPVIAQALAIVSAFPDLEQTYFGPVMFLAGGDSNYVPQTIVADCENLFPNSELATIADAGHWLHAQKPMEVTQAMAQFLSR